MILPTCAMSNVCRSAAHDGTPRDGIGLVFGDTRIGDFGIGLVSAKA